MLTLLSSLKSLLEKEVKIFLLLLLIIIGVWGFIELAENINEDATHKTDNEILLSLREDGNLQNPKGPVWMKSFFRQITALGSGYILVLFSIIVALFLILKKKYFIVYMTIGAVLTGFILHGFLRQIFERERPDPAFHLIEVDTLSFPSGHSMMAAIVYLVLAAFLTQTQKENITKNYILGVALFLTFMIGVSRVYLGVHYPTDVLAGWAVGLSWASIWWIIAWYTKKKRVNN